MNDSIDLDNLDLDAPKAITVTDTMTSTQKQLDFALSLGKECRSLALTDEENAAVTTLAKNFSNNKHDRKALSYVIDMLIEQRDALRDTRKTEREVAQTLGVSTDPNSEVPEGIHYLNGQVHKVQRAIYGSGNLYAKVLNVVTQKFEYAPGAIKSLSEDTVMTIEDGRKFGQLYGVCARCGRTLTDEESIKRGLGPHCARVW